MNELETETQPHGYFSVHSLGCKANFSEGDALEHEFRKQGWKVWSSQSHAFSVPHVCVINSCTVTDEADRQSRKMASRLSRLHPDALIVVTGCAAEVDPERIAASAGIHYVIGNRDKPLLVERVLDLVSQPRKAEGPAEVLGSARGYREILSRHPIDREWPLPETLDSDFTAAKHTRVFLKIQEGCNAFCTYCVIPYGRGPSRSQSGDQVVRQIQELIQTGVREVVLTGTNIGDWGQDFGQCFEDLVEQILRETTIERLRLSSLDPAEITDRLLSLMSENPRLCWHFHVSLQSAHPRILKLMKRKYGLKEIQRTLTRIAELFESPILRPFVGMDVITGFPGESEEEFQEGFEVLRGLPWDRLHVFPYSERAGTPATRLPHSVPVQTRRSRARMLQALSLERMRGRYSEILKTHQIHGTQIEGVLLEQPYLSRTGEYSIMGYTSDYTRVKVTLSAEQSAWGNRARLRNTLRDVYPTQMVQDEAQGEVWIEARIDS